MWDIRKIIKSNYTQFKTKPPVELTCSHCGGVFYRKRNSVKANKTGHYCSYSCNGKANAPKRKPNQ